MKRNVIRMYMLFVGAMLAASLILGLAPGVRAQTTGPAVNVDVNAIDNDSGSFAIGQKHTWILRGGIPEDLKNAKSYVMTCTLDPRLDFEGGTMVILHTRDGRQRSLRIRDHFQLETYGQNLRLALTPAGMAYAASNLGEGERLPEIRLSFRVSINTRTAMGAAIPGSAQLAYTDAAGRRHHTASDRPEVHTGGIHISAADDMDTPLEGAGFRLARPATDRELADSTVPKELLYIDGKKVQVVFLSFYDAMPMTGEGVTEMTTGPDGTALAYGLPYGTYYLIQTKASPGSHRVTQPVPVTVDEISHLTRSDGWQDADGNPVDNTVAIVNTRAVLPSTGSAGRTFFALAGVYVTCTAALLLLGRERRSAPVES